MEFLSDLILAAASLGAAAYCAILARRLKALGAVEGGMGSAIALLSGQVDDLTRALRSAQEATGRAGGRLDGQTTRAEAVARKLELLVASMHDLPGDGPERPSPASTTAGTAASARPPSPWPVDAGRRGMAGGAVTGRATQADAEDETAPPNPRARVLRRRQPGA